MSFEFRDLRAKAATDAGDLAHSQQLLAHKNRDMPNTTCVVAWAEECGLSQVGLGVTHDDRLAHLEAYPAVHSHECAHGCSFWNSDCVLRARIW